MTKITNHQWVTEYKPKTRDGVPDEIRMFETYGTDLEIVKKTDNNHVWTLVDTDYGFPVTCAGFHFVNRIGYYVTEKPWTDEDLFVDDGDEEEESELSDD